MWKTYVGYGHVHAVIRVLTRHQLDQNSQHERASIFQVAPQGVSSGCRGPNRLWACSDSHQGINLS